MKSRKATSLETQTETNKESSLIACPHGFLLCKQFCKAIGCPKPQQLFRIVQEKSLKVKSQHAKNDGLGEKELDNQSHLTHLETYHLQNFVL